VYEYSLGVGFRFKKSSHLSRTHHRECHTAYIGTINITLSHYHRIHHTQSPSTYRIIQTIMTKTRTYSFLVLLWCCGSTTTTITIFVGAFLPLSTSKKSIVVSDRPSPTILLYGGALGNDDFSKIFGKQEAAERRTRDLGREYHPPAPKQPTTKPINTADGGKDESSSSKNTKQRQESRIVEDSPDSVALAINTTKVVPKYVPPSSSF
jgi:hypothetical protein